MKILVTGGAGFIGSHVVDRYLKAGHQVIVVDDLSTGRLSNINPNATFYQMDIRNPKLREVFARERPDIVNHHAAQMNVRRSVSDPLFDADVNVGGSLNLIECAKLFNVRRFIYISTGGAVYGEPEYLPCDENHPIVPICQYGVSKHTVEHYLYLYFLNYGMESIVLRYPNVYGPRQDPQGEAGVVAIFTGQMLSNEQVMINGDGKQTRDYVYVGDCATANILALDVPVPHCVFNIGSSRGTTVNEIFDQLSSIIGYDQKPLHGPAKVGETRNIYLDATNAESILGWNFVTTLEDGLAKTVEYFRQEEMVSPVLYRKDFPVDGPVVKLDEHQIKSSISLVNSDGLSGSIDPNTNMYLHHLEKLISGQSLVSLSMGDILEAAMQSVGAESGSIFILTKDGQFERGALAFGEEIEERASPQLLKNIEAGLAKWVLTNGKPVLVSKTAEDPRWMRSEWEVEKDISRSALGVPIISEGLVCGALTVCHPQEGKFTDEHAAILVTAATMLAVHNDATLWN